MDNKISETRLIHELRHKENKTQAEDLLLRYWHAISSICEITVQESKRHIEPDMAIERVREYIGEAIK